VGVGRVQGKGVGWWIWYKNGKMRPVETLLGRQGRLNKENDGIVNSTIIYCKNFGKCHNVPPIQQ
jgi:hypothetical protein